MTAWGWGLTSPHSANRKQARSIINNSDCYSTLCSPPPSPRAISTYPTISVLQTDSLHCAASTDLYGLCDPEAISVTLHKDQSFFLSTVSSTLPKSLACLCTNGWNQSLLQDIQPEQHNKMHFCLPQSVNSDPAWSRNCSFAEKIKQCRIKLGWSLLKTVLWDMARLPALQWHIMLV